MVKAVIDTNVLVSALLSPKGPPAQILRLAISGQILICIDSRIALEYENVLFRDKFPFEPLDVRVLLNKILQIASAVVPKVIEINALHHEDKKFYEVAKCTGAYLVTGNLKHFPEEPRVVSPAGFLEIVGQL
jgi:putative PIN family toxin of toxin-antitoxin system